MLCKKCGAELPNGTEKCIFCGEPLKDELQEEKNVQETAPAEDTVYDENERKRLEQIEKMIEEKKQQLSEIEQRRNSKKQKQKQKKIITIALITAIVGAGAGIGAYYIKDIIDSGESNVSPSPIPTVSPEISPLPEVTETPLPEISPSPEATDVAQQSSDTPTQSGTQSWTSTGNSGSGKTPSSSSEQSGTSGTVSSSNKTNTKPSASSSGSSASSSSSSSASGQKFTDTGISVKSVNSELAKGGEVIYNATTNRYLMTFTANGVRYYANVSAGSTTDQINGKYMTVTAAPTGETYNGNTVYEISSLTNYSGDGYIIKDSGTRVLTENDIKGFSKEKLALARNEIYARHGREFKMAVYRDYFSKCSWYSKNPNYNYNDDNSNLNSTEIKNVKLILKAENNQ